MFTLDHGCAESCHARGGVVQGERGVDDVIRSHIIIQGKHFGESKSADVCYDSSLRQTYKFNPTINPKDK